MGVNLNRYCDVEVNDDVAITSLKVHTYDFYSQAEKIRKTNECLKKWYREGA